ncbi:bifunctional folylpolyglutamate synthase/dihydrofolate synthase [Corynebacterium choanae]|uniref:bifunctional tetrahydrofolate synthase/dihydrofolate synthase n=1 Tax=Corynebacterium choanae TaxID=1862358 RepID=UPI00361F7377
MADDSFAADELDDAAEMAALAADPARSELAQLLVTDAGLELPIIPGERGKSDSDGGDGSGDTPEELARLAAIEAELDTRWGETQIAPSLDRIEQLCDLLGSPQDAFDSIHVAGTNGKTSTVRMIESLLRAFHRRTGRTTSPHLQRVTERIAIDGQPIAARDYVRLYEEMLPFVEMVDRESVASGGPRMSKFEVLVGLAFSAFADAPAEIGVVEVGLGGSWDATNVLNSDVQVIMPIGIDHTDYLGDTIEQIAAEKAGIIKPRRVADDDVLAPRDSVVIVGEQTDAAMAVILAQAVATDNAVARFGQEFSVVESRLAVGGQQLTLRGLSGEYDEIFLPLAGRHQAHNAACALAAVEAFFGAGPGRQLDVETVRAGFAQVTSPGRLERLRAEPTVLCDSAHNPHGAQALARALAEDFEFRRLVAVVGVLGDKDADGILLALEPVVDEIVVTATSSPRALPVEELAAKARTIFGEDRVFSAPDLFNAVDVAVARSEEFDDDGKISGSGVIITGSVVTAGAARQLFHKAPN